jgi:hypothetical protein
MESWFNMAGTGWHAFGIPIEIYHAAPHHLAHRRRHVHAIAARSSLQHRSAQNHSPTSWKYLVRHGGADS